MKNKLKFVVFSLLLLLIPEPIFVSKRAPRYLSKLGPMDLRWKNMIHCVNQHSYADLMTRIYNKII